MSIEDNDDVNAILMHKPLNKYQSELLGLCLDDFFYRIKSIEEKKFEYFLSYCNKGYYTEEQSNYMDYHNI